MTGASFALRGVVVWADEWKRRVKPNSCLESHSFPCTGNRNDENVPYLPSESKAHAEMVSQKVGLYRVSRVGCTLIGGVGVFAR